MEEPLVPTLSPQERGEGEETAPRAERYKARKAPRRDWVSIGSEHEILLSNLPIKRGHGNDPGQTDRRGGGRQHRLLCRRHVCRCGPSRRAAGAPARDRRNRKQRPAADEL